MRHLTWIKTVPLLLASLMAPYGALAAGWGDVANRPIAADTSRFPTEYDSAICREHPSLSKVGGKPLSQGLGIDKDGKVIPFDPGVANSLAERIGQAYTKRTRETVARYQNISNCLDSPNTQLNVIRDVKGRPTAGMGSAPQKKCSSAWSHALKDVVTKYNQIRILQLASKNTDINVPEDLRKALKSYQENYKKDFEANPYNEGMSWEIEMRAQARVTLKALQSDPAYSYLMDRGRTSVMKSLENTKRKLTKRNCEWLKGDTPPSELPKKCQLRSCSEIWCDAYRASVGRLAAEAEQELSTVESWNTSDKKNFLTLVGEVTTHLRRLTGHNIQNKDLLIQQVCIGAQIHRENLYKQEGLVDFYLNAPIMLVLLPPPFSLAAAPMAAMSLASSAALAFYRENQSITQARMQMRAGSLSKHQYAAEASRAKKEKGKIISMGAAATGLPFARFLNKKGR